MLAGLQRAIAGVLALLLLSSAAYPQQVVQPAPGGQGLPAYTPEQLDQLLAPIALYPDQLLGQILMAATYPLEVVQADRWVKDPNNARLKGDQLAAALETIDWDPSVKSLVPFPQILAMMDERLDWTQSLGDAFLAQQADVMESVQRLRQAAQAAGTLQSTPQQVVTPVGQTIVIQPASPQVVYVPVYNPVVVYGAWPYPDYPPVYIAPPPGFYVGPAIVSGISFSIGFVIVRTFWGWDDWDWDHRRFRVDHDRYNVINNYFIEHNERPRLERDDWEHDSYHRRGVVYHDVETRQKYRSAPAGAPETRRDFRGYDRGSGPAQQAGRPGVGGGNVPAIASKPAEPRKEERAVRGQPNLQHPPATAPRVPATSQHPPPVIGRTPATVQAQPATQHPPPVTGRAPGTVQAPQTARHPPQVALRPPPAAQGPAPSVQRGAMTVQRPGPPAFQGYAKGPKVRAQAERGRASLQTMTSRGGQPRIVQPSGGRAGGAPQGAHPGGGKQQQ
jgi:uncharacterized protein DUF3300